MKNPFERFRQGVQSPSKAPASGPSEGKTPEIDRLSPRPAFPILPSKVFRDFVEILSRKERPVILDIGALIGSNVEYFFNLGVKVHVEDLLGAYQNQRYWHIVEGQSTFDEPRFLEENLDYPESYFDGLIFWDLLNFIEPKFIKSFVQRITPMIKTGGYILAFVHTQNPLGPAPVNKYRLLDDCTLEYIPAGVSLEIKKTYQTRDITQVFVGCQGLKYYLLKHNILEVLLKKD